MPRRPRFALYKLMRPMCRLCRLLDFPRRHIRLKLLAHPRRRPRKDQVVRVERISGRCKLSDCQSPFPHPSSHHPSIRVRACTYPKYRHAHPLNMTSARLVVADFSFFCTALAVFLGADEPPKRYRDSWTSLCRCMEHGGHTHEYPLAGLARRGGLRHRMW
jgi:hypothetical protein